ncbi:MAG: recombinase family protein, partial [Candidatus Promineofilum sp.]|nr:recombinase family protein [Promineifilum sp.]
MTKRAVLYARVSGDDRNNATSSITGQLDLCRQYALDSGYQVIAELSEDDRRPTSGASWDLPQLNQALEMARAGSYDILITRELDRLARNLAKQLVIEEQLQASGVTVEYVYGDYTDTPEGQLNKQIRAVIAEYEREKIRQRMVGGRRRKVAGGEVLVHGNPPYGYRLAEVDGRARLEIVDDMAQVVRLIFGLYLDDCLGTSAIARRLNDLGIPAPSVAKNTAAPQAAKGWSHSAVNRILHNETYAGIWRYGKRHTTAGKMHPEEQHITVSVPAIIGRDIFQQAQEQCRRNFNNSKRNTKGQYLLARRCYCGE